ncbi:MAG: hypothetical protein GX801_08700 [Fibrobacter sp.]|nr:hypothetical protein [Fibrobacter sp.]
MIKKPKGIFEFDLVELTDPMKEFGPWLEKEIIAYPEQWSNWTHKIFKSTYPEIYT